jgi:MFS family permease
VSQLGDRLALVAFPWLVYTTTGSAVSTGVVLAMYTLPYVFFGTVAGALIDRLNKRWVMVGADLVRAALVCAVPFAAQRSLPAVYALTFLTACATVFFHPSLLSLLPEIVDRSRLLRANSLLSTSENVTEIGGYAVAGFLVAAVATRTAFLIDGATFLVSAAALSAMAYRPLSAAAATDIPEGAETDARPNPVTAHRMAAEIREGLAFLFGHRGLRANTILVVCAAIGVGASYPLTFLLAMRAYSGASSFGLMETAIAGGYLAGSLLMATLAKKVRKGLAVTLGLLVIGVGYVVVAALDPLPAVLAAFAVLGLANAAFLISVDTYFQETIPAPLRGRVWGARFTLTQATYAVGVLAAGALAASHAVRPLFVICGVIVGVPALVALFSPAVRKE